MSKNTATATKSKVATAEVAQATAPEVVTQPVTPAVEVKELSEKEKVLQAIKLELSKIDDSQPAAMQSAIVESAHRKLYSYAPDVEFSSNSEQKKAQRLALRERRAELGFAQANLLICDALLKVKGAETTVKFNVRTLANGQVAGTETKVTKTAKRSNRSGIRT